MNREPRTLADYGGRETEAARRVLIDLGQVLAEYFKGSIVVVGGWVPELLLHDAAERHSGSNDVDIAFDPDMLDEGKYAELVKALLATRRYKMTKKAFKLQATVKLGDGGPPIVVDIDFLKPPGKGRGRRGAPRLRGFRPLDADGCAAAFLNPRRLKLEGRTIAGADNTVDVLVASVADFLVMKSYALAGRDKPKDAYDICYSLDHAPRGMRGLGAEWRRRRDDNLVSGALKHLREKFKSVKSYGPRQVVEFLNPATAEAEEIQARRAFELVNRFLELVGEGT